MTQLDKIVYIYAGLGEGSPDFSDAGLIFMKQKILKPVRFKD
ncbi:hypothetical protein KIS1582_4774 [Cytobacillus firmus]|uniref:Uncharacterized protein n=1 Tax=Cytobacillus firmus TaxID=1399 RepID=A0A800N890_CYTFI|nr:hypothetical protein KIS1582_4774 [Cytobacillus firmus]